MRHEWRKEKSSSGNAGGEYPVRDFVTAYERRKPASLRGVSTPFPAIQKRLRSNAMRDAAKTWSGEVYKFGGGNGVGGNDLRSDSNLLFFEPVTVDRAFRNRAVRGLDIFMCGSIVAVKPIPVNTSALSNRSRRLLGL